MAQGARGRSVFARRDRLLAGSLVVVCAACSLLAPSEDEIAGETPGSGTGGATNGGSSGAGATTGGSWASGGSVAGGGTAGSGGAAGSGAADASAGTGGATGGTTGGGGIGATGGTTGGGGTGATGGTTGGGGTGATGGGGTGGTGGVTWWNTAYQSRFPLSVKNVSASTLPVDLQIGLGVLPAQIDGSAVPFAGWRIVRLSGGTWTELPRHVETVKASAWIWWRAAVAINAGNTDTSYWLYASNPTAIAPPSAQAQIFEFFDGFTSFDTTKWASQGVVTPQTDSVLVGGTNNGSIRSLSTFGANTAIDFRMVVVKPLQSPVYWFSGGFQRTNDFTDIDPWVLWISRSPTSIRAEAKIVPMDSVGPEEPVDLGNLHVFSVDRFASKMVFRRDFVHSHTATPATPFTEPEQIRFTAYSQSQLQLYYARVRKAIDPAPTVTVGNKEAYQ